MHAYQLTRSSWGKFPKVYRTFGWLALAALPLAARADEKTAALVRALASGDEPRAWKPSISWARWDRRPRMRWERCRRY